MLYKALFFNSLAFLFSFLAIQTYGQCKSKVEIVDSGINDLKEGFIKVSIKSDTGFSIELYKNGSTEVDDVFVKKITGHNNEEILFDRLKENNRYRIKVFFELEERPVCLRRETDFIVLRPN
jgi:hypothetical protein